MLKMYSELADWWPLLSDVEEYAEEAAVFRDLLIAHQPATRTILELGSGGGNNAAHLKEWFSLTLSDLSEDMLEVSRGLNPECVHVQGDMRTLRLGKCFDAIFVHDAIMYMATEEDLYRVFETAMAHCRDGGVALFAPDWVTETFEPKTGNGGHDGEDRALRYLEWVHDPDIEDTVYCTEYAIVLWSREEGSRVVYDHHEEGIFPKETWLELLRNAGFEPHTVADPLEPDRVLFVGRKP